MTGFVTTSIFVLPCIDWASLFSLVFSAAFLSLIVILLWLALPAMRLVRLNFVMEAWV